MHFGLRRKIYRSSLKISDLKAGLRGGKGREAMKNLSPPGIKRKGLSFPIVFYGSDFFFPRRIRGLMFCHRATDRCSCVKAELTFASYSPWKRFVIFLYKKMESSNKIIVGTVRKVGEGLCSFVSTFLRGEQLNCVGTVRKVGEGLCSLALFWSIALLCFFCIPSYANGNNCNSADNFLSFCDKKREQFTLYWPDSCDCTQLHSDTEKGMIGVEHIAVLRVRVRVRVRAAQCRTLNDCVAEAKAKEACTASCKMYTTYTSYGCNDSAKNIIDQCSGICEARGALEFFTELLLNVYDGPGELFKWEDKLNVDNRNACIQESKDTFITAYTTKCVEHIEEIKENKVLLCSEEGATKSNPLCNKYCAEMAKESYGVEVLDSDSIHDAYSHGETATYESIAYKVLVNSDIDSIVEEAVKEDMNEHIDFNAQSIRDAGEEAGLKWWVCKKGEGMACESKLYRALEEAQDVCSDLQREARECCHEPERCVGGGLAHALDSLGKLHVTIAGIKGQKDQCKAVQQTFGMYGGMQGAMAAQCTRTANACSRGCNAEVEKVAEAFQDACNHDPRTKADYDENINSCDQKLFDYYMKNYNGFTNTERIRIGEVSDECKTTGKEANRRIQDMSTHIGTSLVAGMKECGMEPDEWKPEPVPLGCPPNCPPPPPTCPPICPTSPLPPPSIQTTDGGAGGGGPSNVVDPFANDPILQAANPFDENPDLGEEGSKVGKGIGKGMSGLLGGSGGTGGSGLGGLGGGGSSGGGRNRGGAPTKKKKVLLGFKGGKFTGYGGGGDSREERSRGRASKRGRAKRKMSSLDLKKLLPKGKQLNHKVGKFGSPHDDIFQRLSNRIKWMCRTEQISCR